MAMPVYTIQDMRRMPGQDNTEEKEPYLEKSSSNSIIISMLKNIWSI